MQASSLSKIKAIVRQVNAFRKERGLPTVISSNPRKITAELKRQICIEVWSKYPGALDSADFQLGELTLALVEKEVRQRLLDISRGVAVKQASLKEYFN